MSTAPAAATAEIDRRFSSPDAKPATWEAVSQALERAQIYWISTVRADGRPHVTPLIGAWLGETLYFHTGATEQKTRNLERNPKVALTTGCSDMGGGLDVVVEGEAVRVTDAHRLQQVADLFATKYGEPFVYTVGDGVLEGDGGRPVVFEVRHTKVLAFDSGEEFSQTRWRFG